MVNEGVGYTVSVAGEDEPSPTTAALCATPDLRPIVTLVQVEGIPVDNAELSAARLEHPLH